MIWQTEDDVANCPRSQSTLLHSCGNITHPWLGLAVQQYITPLRTIPAEPLP